MGGQEASPPKGKREMRWGGERRRGLSSPSPAEEREENLFWLPNLVFPTLPFFGREKKVWLHSPYGVMATRGADWGSREAGADTSQLQSVLPAMSVLSKVIGLFRLSARPIKVKTRDVPGEEIWL